MVEGSSIFKDSIYVVSDKRIKNNIEHLEFNTNLQKLRDIQPVSFKFKDKLKKGNRLHLGFIAQQVKEHVPEAVSYRTEFIPSEVRLLKKPHWTTLADDDEIKYKLTIPDLEET